VRQGRHDDRNRLGRGEGLLRVPAGSRGLGPRLRFVGLDQPVRRGRQVALESRVGRAVVAVRGHDRAGRQGPVDRRRLTRPEPTHASPTTSPGPTAAAPRVGPRPSAAPRSSPGTWSGPPSGASSG
jgi:hypothetical protein